MKKIFFLIAVFFSFAGYAQTVGQLRYDTVKMYKVGGTTELIIQNATKDRTNAAFKNMGNGRGAWENVVDSVFKNATADSFVYYIDGVAYFLQLPLASIPAIAGAVPDALSRSRNMVFK